MENAYFMKYMRNGQLEKIWYNTYNSQEKVGAIMSGKTSTASKRKFNDKTYQRIVLDVRIDSDVNKEAIQQAAEKAGQSLTEYMLEAVRRRMEQEQSTAETVDPGVE